MLTKKAAAAFVLAVVCAAAAFAAPAEKPYHRAELIYEPGEVDFPSCHGSTLAELPGGGIIAAWYGGSAEKGKDVAIYASLLEEGETEWSEPRIIHDTPGMSEGNPVLWVDADGALWLFFVTIMEENWNDARMFYKKSDDRGETWTEKTVLLEPLGWMTRNKPLALDGGPILLPIYSEVLFFSQFLASMDGGKTWRKSQKIIAPGGCIQASAVELSDGTLLAGMRTGSENGRLWWSKSASRGRKWSKPYTTNVKNPGSGTDMAKLPNGHIVLAFNDSAERRNPLNIAISTDDGETWEYNRSIDGEPAGASFSYPAVIVDSAGLIHVTYTWKRESIKHVVVNEAWVMEE